MKAGGKELVTTGLRRWGVCGAPAGSVVDPAQRGDHWLPQTCLSHSAARRLSFSCTQARASI